MEARTAQTEDTLFMAWECAAREEDRGVSGVIVREGLEHFCYQADLLKFLGGGRDGVGSLNEAAHGSAGGSEPHGRLAAWAPVGSSCVRALTVRLNGRAASAAWLASAIVNPEPLFGIG